MKLVVALLLVAGAARAGTVHRPEAIDLDTDMTPPGRAELGFDGGGDVGAYALSLQLGFLDRPMRVHTVDRVTYPVEHRETVWLGGALSLGSSVVVDARMPLSHQTGDRWQSWGDERPLDRWVANDLDVGARIRVVHGARFSAFFRGGLTFGTGNDHQFAGDARYSASWLLIGRANLPGGIVLAATGGVRLRGAEVQVADRLVGDELLGAIGASVPVPGCLRVTGELVGVLGDDVAHQRGPSPAEARVGVLAHPRSWLAVALRVGTHVDDQIGAPRLRAMLELVYQGPPVVEHHAETFDDEEDSDD
jgi:hypothetical protein